MKRLEGSGTFFGLLFVTIALFVSGCASDGNYSGTQATVGVGVYGYGYGYPGYYHGDVIVGAPYPPGGYPPSGHPPGVTPPPGGARPPAPPHVSQLPSRPMPAPAPAPRPMPAGGGMRGGGGRR